MARRKPDMGEQYAHDLWGDPTPKQLDEAARATMARYVEQVLANAGRSAQANDANDAAAGPENWKPYADDIDRE